MSSSDLKFFGVVLVVGVTGYFAFFHMDWSRYRGGFQKQKTPTVTFVPEGTLGAKTFKQLQEENANRANNLGPKLPTPAP